MADDMEDHSIKYQVNEQTKCSDVFRDLIRKRYFPHITGNDVVWTLFCNQEDLISWKTRENKFYHRFLSEEPVILTNHLTEPIVIDFAYYSPPIKRAQYISDICGGAKELILKNGFMSEYESYGDVEIIETLCRLSSQNSFHF